MTNYQKIHDKIVDDFYKRLAYNLTSYDYIDKHVEYGEDKGNLVGELDILITQEDLLYYVEVKSSYNQFSKGRKQMVRFKKYFEDEWDPEGMIVTEEGLDKCYDDICEKFNEYPGELEVPEYEEIYA